MNFFITKYEITVLLKYSCHFACAGKLQKVIHTHLPEYDTHILNCTYIEDSFVPTSPGHQELCQVIMGIATDFNIFRRVNIVKSRPSNSTACLCFELGKAVENAEKVVLICTPDEKDAFDQIVADQRNVHVITSCRTDTETEQAQEEEKQKNPESRTNMTGDHSTGGEGVGVSSYTDS